MTPPTGGTPTTTYTDARGRKIELRQYNNTTPTGDHIATRYTYDPADRLVQVTGPGGHQWTSTYDTRGRKSRTTDPDKGTTQYGYDTLDRLIWTQDSRGHRGKVFHDYDALGRKLRTYAADSAGEKGELIALWGYDTVQAGKQSFASRRAPGPDGTIREYKVRADAYDLMGRPTQTSVIIPEGESGLANTYQFTTVYNIDGTVQSHSLPAAGDLPAETLVTSYDEFKRPVKLTGISPYVTGTGYGNIGRLDSMVLSSGGPAIYQSYGYDPATGRMTNHAVLRQDIDGPVRDTTYTHDDAGNIRQITDKASSGTETQCFTYDYQRRLTNAWTQGTDSCANDPASASIGGPAPYRISYGYDDTGNRTSEKQYDTAGNVLAQRNYTYAGQPGAHASAVGHMLSGVTQTGSSPITGMSAADARETYQYDTAGNTTNRTIGTRTQTFHWAHDGELSKITDTGSADGTGKGDTSYVYTADGDRLITREPVATTLYLPGGMELRVAKDATTPKTTRYYNHAGQTVATRTINGVTFLINDHQGTAQTTVDGHDLTKTHQRRYTPFGQLRTATGGWPTMMNKGFVGGTGDTTGLTHLKARQYDPNTGRFISVDPLIDYGDPQQMNGYNYANNSPVTFSDPDGLRPCRPGDHPHIHGCTYGGGDRYTGDGGGGSGGGGSGGGGSGGPSCSSYLSAHAGCRVGASVVAPTVVSAPQIHRDLIAAANAVDGDAIEWGTLHALIYAGLNKLGSGKEFIMAFKRQWVRGYGKVIKAAASKYDIPAHLLAGVVFNEVGGDPPIVDNIAYTIRALAGKNAGATSFGNVSAQMRLALKTLGYGAKVSNSDRSRVMGSLMSPEQNIFLAAKILSDLRDGHMAGRRSGQLGARDVATLGAMYNGGPGGANLPETRAYGNLIVHMRPELESLLN